MYYYIINLFNGVKVTIEVNLDGKVAMITGASSGLGARFSKILANAGAQVILASRRVDRLKDLRAEIESNGGAAYVLELDVTDNESIFKAFNEVEHEIGVIDILINNSGVSTTQKLIDVSPEDYSYVMNTNLKGAFFIAQKTAKLMLKRAKENPNLQYRIINIASVAGLKVLSKIGIYCISKSGLIQMTKSMALEWGKYGINVNAICPGYIETEINTEYFNSENGKKLIEKLPRKRVGVPENLDGLVLLLSSDSANFINGSIISADDGFAVF